MPMNASKNIGAAIEDEADYYFEDDDLVIEDDDEDDLSYPEDFEYSSVVTSRMASETNSNAKMNTVPTSLSDSNLSEMHSQSGGSAVVSYANSPARPIKSAQPLLLSTDSEYLKSEEMQYGEKSSGDVKDGSPTGNQMSTNTTTEIARMEKRPQVKYVQIYERIYTYIHIYHTH
jgi:hypothetical protein